MYSMLSQTTNLKVLSGSSLKSDHNDNYYILLLFPFFFGGGGEEGEYFREFFTKLYGVKGLRKKFNKYTTVVDTTGLAISSTFLEVCVLSVLRLSRFCVVALKSSQVIIFSNINKGMIYVCSLFVFFQNKVANIKLG